jgi:hypothetical protein
MIRIATILVLAGFCLVAPVHAKRCRALCAAEIGSCRSECSEGSRRERRRCRATCSKSVLATCRQLAEPVCLAPTDPVAPTDGGDPPPTEGDPPPSAGDPPPAEGNDPPPSGESGVCGPVSTCASLAEYAIGWQPGVSATPPDFPPPPPGAVLCGADDARITHYLYSGPMSEVVAYYRQQLEAQSMSFSGPDTQYALRTECDELYLYSRPGQVVPDQLFVSVHQGHFTVTGFTPQ